MFQLTLVVVLCTLEWHVFCHALERMWSHKKFLLYRSFFNCCHISKPMFAVVTNFLSDIEQKKHHFLFQKICLLLPQSWNWSDQFLQNIDYMSNDCVQIKFVNFFGLFYFGDTYPKVSVVSWPSLYSINIVIKNCILNVRPFLQSIKKKHNKISMCTSKNTISFDSALMIYYFFSRLCLLFQNSNYIGKSAIMANY